jgi:hypothetical protein
VDRLIDFRPDEAGSGDGGWQRPDDWPDQFTDPSALLKAYNDMRPEMNRAQSREQELTQMLAQQDADYRAQLEALSTPPPPASNGQSFDPYVARFTQAAEQGDWAAMMAAQTEMTAANIVPIISQQLQNQFEQFAPTLEATQAAQRESMIRMAEDLVARDLGPDRYTELLPAIREVVADHPNYLPSSGSVEGYRESIMAVARLAEHGVLQQRVADLEQERNEKLAAQTLSGAGRGSIYSPDEQEQIRQRISGATSNSYESMMRGK